MSVVASLRMDRLEFEGRAQKRNECINEKAADSSEREKAQDREQPTQHEDRNKEEEREGVGVSAQETCELTVVARAVQRCDSLIAGFGA